MSNYKEIFPEDFHEGLKFKDYPEATNTYEMKSIEKNEQQNLVVVQFSLVGENQTYAWSGRLGLNGTQKSSVWALAEPEPLTAWQELAIEFFGNHSGQEISQQIKGLTVSACDRVLSHQPLSWDSFLEAKLTDNQMKVLETYFSGT